VKKAKAGAQSVEDLVGGTPLVELTKIAPSCSSRVFAKLEFLNPSGSIKDRMALAMIREAERAGLLDRANGKMKIVEATSGNTGIAFAMLAASRGYEFTAVMPEAASVERRALMRQYGARIVLTRSPGCVEAVAVAKRIAEREGAWMPSQYENEANARAHEETGAEIIAQVKELGLTVGAFVAGIGTGGTLVGVARALQRSFPHALIIGAEPEEKAGEHGIEGIGVGFTPALFSRNRHAANEIARVTTKDAVATARLLAKREGLRAGISAGANVAAALRIAEKVREGIVVTVLPDASDRYYSTELFE